FGDRVHQRLRRLLRESLEQPELIGGDAVEVGRGLKQPCVEQLTDALGAQSLNVHPATRGEVHQRLVIATGARSVEAVAIGLALRPNQGGTTVRAFFRRLPFDLVAGALLAYRPQHLRNHVARADDLDHVADAHVTAGDYVLVVQRRARHGDAPDSHRFEDRSGGERAGATDV